MSAMLATVLADDLLLLFGGWELTGIASFLLIGFFAGERSASAYGARRALLVTLATGLGLLAAVLCIKAQVGQTRISALLAEPAPLLALPHIQGLLLLMLLAAFGKSAQVPFHFWLPGAMEAPTPVSAYLHSATMVKLGVFLVGRLYPLFHEVPGWSPALAAVGGISLLVGAQGAFRRNDIKAVLAYTTFAMLGALFLWYGLAPRAGVEHVEALGLTLVLGHVLYKGCLFMVAGIADHSAGTRDLRKLKGVQRIAPLSGLACLLAGASMAGLPGTFGFIGKEALIEAALGFGRTGRAEAWCLLAVLFAGTAFFTAVALRLYGAFTGDPGPEQGHWHPSHLLFQAPPLLLGLTGLALGLLPAPAADFLGKLNGENFSLHAWHGLGPGFLFSATAWSVGLGLYFWRFSGNKALQDPSSPDLGEIFDRGILALTRLSSRVARLIRMDYPADYLSIIIAAGALILGWAVFFVLPPLPAGPWADISLLEGLLLALMAASVIGVVLAEKWTTRLLWLSTAGFLVCFYFMLAKAPDLALTQMLIETATLVLMLLLLGRFPAAAQAADEGKRDFNPRRGVAAVLSLGLAVAVFFLMLHVTAAPHPRRIGHHFLEQTRPLALGANAVNTILVDFRGFDTLFEITVLCIAALGCLGLLMRRRDRREEKP
jgi:NADH:ubiquinone oxidoreductase subunit 5 (subunit L)/multisubunit Na+/H+ antiporter MnhA subunit/multisubunit Na+/H+ antiporter MnhB subunit